jgi:anti-sigma factor RsiW
MMFQEDCQHTRDHLVAYINGELGRRRTRRIADHLRGCETCYAAYVRERDTARNLTSELTLLGRADAPQFDALWSHIETQLTTAPATRAPRPASWTSGLVGVALAMLVALPWTLFADEWVASAAFPIVATPAMMPEETPAGTDSQEGTPHNRAIAALNLATEDPLPATPTSTPAVAPIPNDLP